MELRHLRYFLAVVREGNFARAARRLAVDPSTLYRRLGDLELDVGTALFDRRDGEIRLSAAGRPFAVHARRIVDEATLIGETMASLAKGRDGIVRIGTNGIAAELPLVAAALIHARQALPDLDIHLSVVRPGQLDRIREGTLDLGLFYGRWDAEPDIGFSALQQQRFVLALARGHPLAQVENVRLADLAGEAFVFQSRTGTGAVHDRLIAACSVGGLVPDIRHYIVDEDTQLAMVAAGMGITLTLEGAAARRWRRQLVFRTVTDLDVTVDLDLVWSSATLSANGRRVADAIRAAALSG